MLLLLVLGSLLFVYMQDYSNGDLLTGDLKKTLIETLTPLVVAHQTQRKTITDQQVMEYMKPRPLNGTPTVC